jgi:hypothetical protein
MERLRETRVGIHRSRTKTSMTRAAGALVVAAALGWPVVVAVAVEPVTVYVLPIPRDAAALAAKSGLAPTPFTATSLFTVTIDGSRKVTVDTTHGSSVGGLDPKALHTVRVKVDGKAFARFKFQMDDSWGFGTGPQRVAVYMDAMYANWRVWRCDKVPGCDKMHGAGGGGADASPPP